MQQETRNAASGQLPQCGQNRCSLAPRIIVADPGLEEVAENVEYPGTRDVRVQEFEELALCLRGCIIQMHV